MAFSDDLSIDRLAPHHSSIVNVLRAPSPDHRFLVTRRATPDLSVCLIGQKRVKGGPGTGRLSHAVAHAVSLALGRFTTVFGKGTGGTTPLAPPGPPRDREASLAASRGQQPGSRR